MPIIGSLPVTLTNGTTADATQVMADFNYIVTQVNLNAAANGANSDITSLTGLTTPLGIAYGGTGQDTLEEVSKINWAVAGGTANAITATYSPALTAGTLVDGTLLGFRATTINSSATVTFSPNSLTARNITRQGGLGLAVGDIAGNLAEYIIRYNLAQTRWELLNPSTARAAPGTYAIRGLQALNNAGTPNSQIDISCDQLVSQERSLATYNLQVSNNPGTITLNISTAGPAANGRDQAGAFSNNSWIHLYYIFGGGSLATIASTVAPPTGPTLPTSYTHWAYIGAYRVDGSGNLVKMFIRGSRCFYYAGQNALTTSTYPTSETTLSLSAYMPPNSIGMLLKIYGSIGVSGGGALDTQFQIRTVTTFVYDITRLRGAASTADVCMNFQFQTFNSGSAIIYLWTNTTNAVAREYAIDVLGFSIPNGDTN